MKLQGRYNKPSLNDVVIGIVVGKTNFEGFEMYRVDINSVTEALLPCVAFTGATKRNYPAIDNGSAILAIVTFTPPRCGTESCMLTCLSEMDSKNWMTGENYLGVLHGRQHSLVGSRGSDSNIYGHILDIPKEIVDSILEDWILENHNWVKLLADRIPRVSFECVAGKNGRLWFMSDDEKHNLPLRSCIQNLLSCKTKEEFDMTIRDAEKHFDID